MSVSRVLLWIEDQEHMPAMSAEHFAEITNAVMDIIRNKPEFEVVVIEFFANGERLIKAFPSAMELYQVLLPKNGTAQ